MVIELLRKVLAVLKEMMQGIASYYSSQEWSAWDSKFASSSDSSTSYSDWVDADRRMETTKYDGVHEGFHHRWTD